MNREQFEARVDRSGGPDACWPWQGARTPPYGAGQAVWNGRVRPATHVALEIAGRPLAPGELARHTCDNPPCVNPAHLLAGTQRDNIHDMIARRRGLVGALNCNAIPVGVVRSIARASGSQRQVAARFGVSQPTVGVIRRGEHWSQTERSA